MNSIIDLESKLKVELIHWFPIQCREIHQNFYLTYQESTPERDGSIMITRELAPGYQYAASEAIMKGQDVQANFLHFRRFLGSLPVLSMRTA